MNEQEVFQSFVREISMLPKDRVSADGQDILFPVERFVVAFEEKAHEEQTQYGTKASLCVCNVCCCCCWCLVYIVVISMPEI